MTADEWTHVVTGGPWPERLGLRCRIAPPLRDEYPWTGLRYRRGEVVVLVEDDPFNGPGTPEFDREWTCTISASDITGLTS